MNLDHEDMLEASGKYVPTYEQFCAEYEAWLNSEAFKKSLDEQEAARG
jgi:hypothetical protein